MRHGFLPDAEVSRLFARARFALTNVTPETWSKSGVFMACAATGCAAVIKIGRLPTCPAFLCDRGRGGGEDFRGGTREQDRFPQGLVLRKCRLGCDCQKTRCPLGTDGGGIVTGETVIICPELAAGGVGDYTRRLLEHLPRIAGLRLIVPRVGTRPVSSFEQYPVEETDGTVRDLRDRLPAHGKVLVQYSAYGFDRHGYPRWLIKALLDWKKESHGILAIMFHEIWAFWPIWNKNHAMQQLHRRDLRRLLRVADAVFTSTASQAAHLTALSPRCPVQVLPVGSNIRRAQTTEEKGKRDLRCSLVCNVPAFAPCEKMHRRPEVAGRCWENSENRDRGRGSVAAGRR